MNPEKYSLSKDVLQQMLDSDYNSRFHQFETIYDRQVRGGMSPSDLSQYWVDRFFEDISEPLKRMQVEYLQNAVKNCYKQKWLRDDGLTNLEAIMVCKEAERAKVFSRFERMYSSHRDSGRFKFQDCLFEAGNNPEKAVLCVRDYVRGVKDDNEKMQLEFSKEYSRFIF